MLKRSGKLQAVNLTDLRALTPQMVARAYNFPPPPVNIKDQCVAIVELGGQINYFVLAAYCLKMKVAFPQLFIKHVGGAPIELIPDPNGADGEVALDACIIAAICSGAKILIVYGENTNQGFADAISYCATSPLKPNAVSISWGAAEVDWDMPSIDIMEAAIKQCVDLGINVYVAAGDSGCDDGVNDDKDHVDYPASSPQVIACGGTRLQLNADGSRQNEVVWGPPNSDNGASGGGVSTLLPCHDDQEAICSQRGTDRRLVPDVAGDADPATGYLVNVDGLPMAIGGTSAVAPLYAALNALLTGHLNRFPSEIRKTLYANPGLLYDVVDGTNADNQGSGTAQVAGPGFDLCSGLGVPDGQALLNALSSSDVPQSDIH